MALRSLRPCRDPVCPALTREKTGYCDEHKALADPWATRRQGTTKQRGYSGRWKKLRAAVLEAAQYTCQIRGPRCTIRATEVDHILNKARGGTDDLDNLQAVCRTCHHNKTVRESRA